MNWTPQKVDEILNETEGENLEFKEARNRYDFEKEKIVRNCWNVIWRSLLLTVVQCANWRQCWRILIAKQFESYWTSCGTRNASIYVEKSEVRGGIPEGFPMVIEFRRFMSGFVPTPESSQWS